MVVTVKEFRRLKRWTYNREIEYHGSLDDGEVFITSIYGLDIYGLDYEYVDWDFLLDVIKY